MRKNLEIYRDIQRILIIRQFNYSKQAKISNGQQLWCWTTWLQHINMELRSIPE